MSEMIPGLCFAAEKCIQCHACETACAAWRGLESGMSWRRVGGRFRGSYPGVRLVSFSVSCLHCAEPECAAVCPTGAVYRREDGIVAVERSICVGCRACLDACPVDAPRFGADGLMEKCDMCADCAPLGEAEPVCVRVCPTRALERRLLEPAEKREQEREQAALYGKTGG